MSKRWKINKNADDAYIPMYQDYINDIEVNHKEWDNNTKEFLHPYFINKKRKKS